MDHEAARSLFTGYHDGDLREADRAALEEHLALCGECRAEWEAYRRTVGEISGLRVVPLPDDFGERVSRAIEERRRRRLIGVFSYLNIRVIVLLVVLIMLFVMAYLTWLLFAGAGGAGGAGASRHDRGDYHIIGPVRVETQPPPERPPGREEGR